LPDWKQEIRRRLAGSKLNLAREAEVVEELSQHLEDRFAESLADGATPEEASRAALAELRDGKSLLRELRQVERPVNDEPVVLGAGRKNMIADLWQDLRYAARCLRKHVLLSTVVIATLTLGIGISAGIFTLINAMAFRAPVDKDYDTFVRIYSAYTTDPARPGRPGAATLEDYLAFRDRAKSLGAVTGWAKFFAPLGQDDASETRALFVTDNFFALYDLEQPLLGRLLQPVDFAAANPVVVLSERIWRSRFVADTQVVGKVTQFNGQPVTIVGVAPTFAGQLDGVDAWVPYTLQTYLHRGDDLMRPGEAGWLTVEGRLQPGFTRREVAAELALLAGQQDSLHPGRKTTLSVTDGSMFQEPEFRASAVWLLPIMVGLLNFIVLLACANVATLLLSRADARQQEIAVRLALGAGRLRLFRMLLMEPLLLAAAAGLASLYFAYRMPGVLIAWLGDPQYNQVLYFSLRPDWRVFAYLAVITLLAGALAGLSPALQSLKVNLSESLKGRGPLFGAATGGARLRVFLVGAQVALSLVLLLGALLSVRAYRRMSAADPGYDTRQVIFARVMLSGKDMAQYSRSGFNLTRDQRLFAIRLLTQRLEALPGVQSVAFTNWKPLFTSAMFEVQVPGQPMRQVAINGVSPGFFTTLGIPIVSGRALRESDPHCGTGNCPVVVSEELARRFWPGVSPLGMELRYARSVRYEVVGVARDVSTQRLGGRDGPTLYLPWVPNQGRFLDWPLVRFTGDGAAMAQSIAGAIRELSPELSIEARTIQSHVDEALGVFRRLERLVSILGAIAVALAVIGIYGVVSFAVSRRTKEMGIRIALGAQKRDIYVAVLGAGARPVVLGLLVGLSLAWAAAFAQTRELQKAPIAFNALDPLTFAAAALLMAAVSLAAMLGPARRATRVDPIEALREE
jgi:putative ABC transport system permease protein